MKVYIAGPMTHIPYFNFPAFDALARELRSLDVSPALSPFEVVNPAEEDGPEVRLAVMQSLTGDPADLPPGMTHGDFLSRDVKLIADGGITAVTVLPGWERSKGARHETFVAHLNDIPVVKYEGSGTFATVPKLELFRAWTQEPDLYVYTPPFSNGRKR